MMTITAAISLHFEDSVIPADLIYGIVSCSLYDYIVIEWWMGAGQAQVGLEQP